MIWDFIRDFFVQYIFGGCTSSGDFYGGALFWQSDDTGTLQTTDMAFTHLEWLDDWNGGQVWVSVGDWLSTTATIICMCLIVFMLICLVRWIFRAVSSAFLLK